MKIKIIILILLMCSFVMAEDVLLLQLHYKEGDVTLINSEFLRGYSPDRKIQEGDYSLVIKSNDNRRLYSFNFDVPNKIYTDSSEGGDVVYIDDFDFYLLVPYYRDAKYITVLKDNEQLSDFSLEVKERDYTILYLFFVLLIFGVILFFIFLRFNRNTYKKHKGVK